LTRVLVAGWPDWPVVAAGYPPDVPAAVLGGGRIVAATLAARDSGVSAGLRRREAQGRCPELELLAADPARDARAWEPVVAAVEALAVGVEVWGSGRLCLPTRGPSRYFGGDAALSEKVKVVAEAAAGQPGCRVGVAGGRFAATLAGLSSPLPVVVPPGEDRAWLAPHPVMALGSGFEELSDLLVRLGIRTLGELAALPGRSVVGRFGALGQAAQRLARGQDGRPLAARRPPPELTCTALLDPPELRVEAAAFIGKALADEMNSRLSQAGLVCTAVAVEAEGEHGERLVRRWRHEGSLTASALAERVRWQLEGWDDCAGGLVLLRLSPEEVRPDTGRQLDFWGQTADGDARAARALARVQGLLGPDAVVTAVLAGGRACADQVRLVPWGSPGSPERSNSEGMPPWPGRIRNPSPALVHQPPLRAGLLDPDGGLVQVNGRGMLSSLPASLALQDGPARRVTAWAGPWPLEERWWDSEGRRRARLQVLLEDGEAHLVYREGGRWWVEASYA
jgi:protein ImuB